MQNRGWGLILSIIFVGTTILILLLNQHYISYQKRTNSEKIYHKLSSNIIKKVQTLIEEKKNATLTIALAFAQDEKLKNAIVYHENIQPLLRNFSLKLREETDFKNVWFQLVDKNGTVVSRSWSTQKGDNLFKVRSFRDVTKVSTTIDVDKYDLSFKASVPIFNEGKFIGFIETITHFNSIAKKIEKEGFYPLVVVDKAYSQNLKHPFTHYFIDDYYIANKNVDARIVEHIKEYQGIEEFLAYKKSFTIDSHNYLIVHHTLFDAYSNKTMVYILMFQELNQALLRID